MSYAGKTKKNGRPLGIPRSPESIEKQKNSLNKSRENKTYLPWGFKPKSLYPIKDIGSNTGDI